MVLSERASQEEQNGVNFIIIAPSSEEWLPIVYFNFQIQHIPVRSVMSVQGNLIVQC